MSRRLWWLIPAAGLIGYLLNGAGVAAQSTANTTGDTSGVAGCQIATATPVTGQLLMATGSTTCAWTAPSGVTVVYG